MPSLHSFPKSKSFLVVALFLLSLYTDAQVIKPLFYNKQWEITVKDSAEYFRMGILDTTNHTWIGPVKDYQIDGRLVMEGVYLQGKRNGLFNFNYLNGSVEQSGEFKDNVQIGYWKYFYPNGNLKQEIEFTSNGFTVHSHYDSTGKQLLKEGTGYWEETFYEFQVSEPITNRGNFVAYKRDGKWSCSIDNQVIYEEVYMNGQLISSKQSASGKLIRRNPPEELKNKLLPPFKLQIMEEFVRKPYVDRHHYPFLSFLPKPLSEDDSVKVQNETSIAVEETAIPYGGMIAFYEYVAKKLAFPKSARGKVNGKVFVQFVINIDGSISDVVCIKGLGYGCDEEAVRVVRSSPKWIPGNLKGVPVRQRMVLPISFISSL